jgi:pimeloyl-ACP methyl ester carboxylesterase
VGHDWGSAITWGMVMQKPELFRKFCSLSVGHLGAVFSQVHSTPERMLEAAKTHWFTYHHTQAGMEELYMTNDFRYFDTFFVQHPEKEEVKRLIKETGHIEWLNYDIANPMVLDYLATAKDPKVYPNTTVPTMVIYPEQDMFLWPTQAIDTPRHLLMLSAVLNSFKVAIGLCWITLTTSTYGCWTGLALKATTCEQM